MQILIDMGALGLALANMITNIQFLFRLTMLADLFLTGLFVITVKYLWEKYRDCGNRAQMWLPRILMVVVMSGTLVQTLSLETAVMATQYNSKYQKYFITELDELFCKNIGNEEYIPRTLVTGWSWSGLYDVRTIVVTGGRAFNLSKTGTNMHFTVQTEPDATAWIDIPLIYYFGYHAYNSDTGEEIGIFQNNSGKISFIMPGGTTWNVDVVYEDKPNWKKANMVSLVTFVCIMGILFFDVCKKRRNLTAEGQVRNS